MMATLWHFKSDRSSPSESKRLHEPHPSSPSTKGPPVTRIAYSTINTVGELVLWTAADLRRVKNCGKVTVQEIRSELARLGLHLKGE